MPPVASVNRRSEERGMVVQVDLGQFKLEVSSVCSCCLPSAIWAESSRVLAKRLEACGM